MTIFKVHYTAPNGNKLSTFASVDDIVNGRAKLGINPDAKPVNMTPEDAAKLDWVHVGDPRPRHH